MWVDMILVPFIHGWMFRYTSNCSLSICIAPWDCLLPCSCTPLMLCQGRCMYVAYICLYSYLDCCRRCRGQLIDAPSTPTLFRPISDISHRSSARGETVMAVTVFICTSS